MIDPFQILGAERRFDLDLEALEKTHRELSRALHPDKFSRAGASERRDSLERMANVNEAWRTLRDPIRRAEALFKLEGFLVGETNEPKASPMFLMEVMEDREALADARGAKDLAKVRKLGVAMEARAKGVETKLTLGFANTNANANANANAAKASHKEEKQKLLPLLGELRFYKRFLDECRAIEEEAEEAQASL